MPLEVRLWNGQRLISQASPRVRITVRSEKTLADLSRPTMGGLARHYVDEALDIDGSCRDALQIGEALSTVNPGIRPVLSPLWRRFRHARRFDRRSIESH